MSKKNLGLDLGTNSIGWALIEVDENLNPIRIIAMGSRIIPLNSEDRDQFQKGQAISKNHDRTLKRNQRKGYDRKQLKKSDLKKILQELNIFPSKELLQLPSLELWKLRSDAATKKITPKQLGRILYMLNQKRGYQSARSEANQDKKDTDYVAEVKGRFAQLKERNQTIGEYFFEELKTANTNNTYFRIKEKVYPREAYIEEFDAIIRAQKAHHDFLTDEAIEKIKNEIIYYQRKLKSQKGLVNVCDFEGFERKYFDKETGKEKTSFVGPKVAPKTSPLFQLCKIWESVNNISLKIKNPEGSISKYKWSDKILSIEEKKEIAEYLFQRESLSFTELLKILNLNKENVYANKQISKGIQGNITLPEIQKLIGDRKDLLQFNIEVIAGKHPSILIDKKTGEVLAEEESLQINPKIEREPLYQLWHTIYSIKDMIECKNALIKRFNFSKKIADKLSKIDFNKQSFGNKSNKAMRKILPYLMQGYDYSQACSLAGYNHSNSLTKHERNERVTADKLTLLPKNSLRQPVVEKIINQMINVVNAIIDKHGKPDEIRIELARVLKQSKEERNDAEKRNMNNKKLNDEVTNRLTELGIPSTKRYIQKYKFIFPSANKNLKDAQVTNQCIYCGQTFNLTEALTGDNFDVDHIIPKTLLFDDSQTNKVLVHRKCNSTKTNQTAYDYISKKGENELNEYLARVDDWYKKGLISYGKMSRLKTSYEEYLERKRHKKETKADKKLWGNFIDRQLRESQYISRKSTEILQEICNNITATEGTVTARLRELWGWDDILMNLQLPKYKELGQTEIKEWTSDHGKRKHQKEQITNWTKRDDHRHHAIDALVIACTRQGYIQRINTLNASETKDAMQKQIDAAKIKYGRNYDENILKDTNEIVQNHSGRLTQLEEYLIAEKPFNTRQVSEEAKKILVSFKAGKKVATNGVRKEKINGKKKIVQKGIIIPRGALHEESVYGVIKVKDKDKSLKYLLENPEKIIDKKKKALVEARLQENGNDLKETLASLKKRPIYLDETREQTLDEAACFKDEYVIKYPLQSLKAKDVPFIVDEKIKSIIRERLAKYNNKEKEAFKDVLWFNERKQIPILTVRCFTGLSIVETIKKDENGKHIGFVVPGNNHHIAIYKDRAGKLIQHSCTFWDAVERKKYKVPYIIKNTEEVWNNLLQNELPQSFLDKLPTDNLKLQFSMQQNEMFILGLSVEEFEKAVREDDKSVLSRHLYLVWSITDGDYWFRHHLETKNSELKKINEARETKRYYRLSQKSLLELNPVKVRLNHLGEITKIGE